MPLVGRPDVENWGCSVDHGSSCACPAAIGWPCGGEFAENRSISRAVADTTAGSCCCDKSLKTKELGVVIKVKPIGMLWMISAGWLNHRSGAAWQARKAPLEGRLIARMNKFTLLDDAVRGCRSRQVGWRDWPKAVPRWDTRSRRRTPPPVWRRRRPRRSRSRSQTAGCSRYG